MTSQMDYEWDLEELALLRPFEDDPDAMAQITAAAAYGQPIRYVIQRITDDREAEAHKTAMIAELTAAGITVTTDWPAGAVSLSRLLDGDQEMTPETHAACPGRGASIPAWRGAGPAHYCLDPARYSHVFASTGTTTPPAPVTPGPADADRKPPADRKIVVEGNRAWKAAGTVRQQWLAELFTRKTPPRNAASAIARFVTGQIIAMPAPLCRALGGARQSRLFELFGKPGPEAAAASTLPGLWMLALAPIAAAYELEMTGDGDHRNTWRTDGKYSPCSRKDAGAWLRFTATIGYPLSPIEQAVADEVPYLGDSPAESGTDADTGILSDNEKEDGTDAGDDTASQNEKAPEQEESGQAESAGTQAQAGTEAADAGAPDDAGPRSPAGSHDQASTATAAPGDAGPADHAGAVAA